MISISNLITILILGFITALLLLYIKKLSENLKLKMRWNKAKKGEKKAVNLLKKYNFNILSEQPVINYPFYINDEINTITLRPDFIAERNNKKYIIDVKTGNIATNPTYSQTRRQLLEYSVISGIDGVFLLDMERIKLIKVSFFNEKEFEKRTVTSSIIKESSEVKRSCRNS